MHVMMTTTGMKTAFNAVNLAFRRWGTNLTKALGVGDETDQVVNKNPSLVAKDSPLINSTFTKHRVEENPAKDSALICNLRPKDGNLKSKDESDSFAPVEIIGTHSDTVKHTVKIRYQKKRPRDVGGNNDEPKSKKQAATKYSKPSATLVNDDGIRKSQRQKQKAPSLPLNSINPLDESGVVTSTQGLPKKQVNLSRSVLRKPLVQNVLKNSPKPHVRALKPKKENEGYSPNGALLSKVDTRNKPLVQDINLQCEHCKKLFLRKCGWGRHVKTCKLKKPKVLTPDECASDALVLLAEMLFEIHPKGIVKVPVCKVSECASDALSDSSWCLKHKNVTISESTDVSDKGNEVPKNVECLVQGCHTDVSKLDGRLCIAHGGTVRCKLPGCKQSCTQKDNGNERLCSLHGGARYPCARAGCCRKVLQLTGKNSLCKAHGGGPRCEYPNCKKHAQSGGLSRRCVSHGGGPRCQVENCNSSARSTDGGRVKLCVAHGGGHRCKIPKCNRLAEYCGKDKLCVGHGGGRRCQLASCDKPARSNGTGAATKCIEHGGGYRCKVEGCNKHINIRGKGTKRDRCIEHGGEGPVMCHIPQCKSAVHAGGKSCFRHREVLV